MMQAATTYWIISIYGCSPDDDSALFHYYIVDTTVTWKVPSVAWEHSWFDITYAGYYLFISLDYAFLVDDLHFYWVEVGRLVHAIQ